MSILAGLPELNRIYQGDCLDIMRSWPDGSVDLIVTDPPYGVGYVTSWRSRSDALVAPIANDSGDWLHFAAKWVAEAIRVLKNDAHFYCFGSFVTQTEMRSLIEKHITLKNVLVWDKMNWSVGDLEGDYGRQYELIYFAHKGRRLLSGRRTGNIFRVSRGSGAEYEHPTQKPVDLMGLLIEQSSNPGDIVLDPFAGGGSSLVAAEHLGRRWIGCEINPDYVKLAQSRVDAEKAQGKLF